MRVVSSVVRDDATHAKHAGGAEPLNQPDIAMVRRADQSKRSYRRHLVSETDKVAGTVTGLSGSSRKVSAVSISAKAPDGTATVAESIAVFIRKMRRVNMPPPAT